MGTRYAEFIRLFNKGHYFEAHEALETLWRTGKDRDRKFFHGMIQIAAVFVHLQRQNRTGARDLYERARRNLEGYGPVFRGVPVPEFLETVAGCLDRQKIVCPFKISKVVERGMRKIGERETGNEKQKMGNEKGKKL